MLVNLSKPSKYIRSHLLIIQPRKECYGKICAFALWAHDYDFVDLFKLIKLIFLDKNKEYLNRDRKFLVKIDKEETPHNTHTIQLRTYLDRDKKKYGQESFSFSISEPDLTIEEMKKKSKEYLYGKKEIKDSDMRMMSELKIENKRLRRILKDEKR